MAKQFSRRAAALKEPWVLAEDEVDWPTVLRV